MPSRWGLPAYLPLLLPMTQRPRSSYQTGRSGSYLRSLATAAEARILDPLVRDLSAHWGVGNLLYLSFLKLGVGDHIAPHTDDCKALYAQCLYMIQPAVRGGVLHLGEQNATPMPTAAGECLIFDANATRHFVSPVEEGERHVLSVGFGCSTRR